MEVIKRGEMKNGTKIQVEDWSESYPVMDKLYVLGAYPKSKISLKGDFAPKENRTFRCTLQFQTLEEVETAFESLLEGKTTLKDYEENFREKELLQCI